MKLSLNDAILIAGHAAYNLLFAFAVVGLLIGLMLIFNSARVFRWNEGLNVWISTRAVLRPLERARDISAHFYRRNRVVGVLLILAALYALYVLIFAYQAAPIVHAYRDLVPPAGMEWILESLYIFLIIGSIAVMIIGAMLFARPLTVRALEGWANRQYSERQAMKSAETMNYGSDRFIRAHPTLVGALVSLASLYVLLALWLFWHL